MVEIRDPSGTGRGSDIIWGGKTRIVSEHSVGSVVCMADNGPNTNVTQFFTTWQAFIFGHEINRTRKDNRQSGGCI